jgi:hypothetical protein
MSTQLISGFREEQQPLENFFRAKGIKTKNEMADDVSKSMALSNAELIMYNLVWGDTCRSTARRRSSL